MSRRLGILLFLLFVSSTRVAIAKDAFCEEDFAKANQALQKNSFKVNRGIRWYEDYFPGLLRHLRALDRQPWTWLDLGAGRAAAQLEYQRRQSPKNARLIAWGFKKPDNFSTSTPGGFTYLEGDFLKADVSGLSGLDVITDVYGVLTYSEAPDEVLSKSLALLKIGGEMYIYGLPARTVIKVDAQNEIGLFSLLFRIKGILVEDDGVNFIRVRRVPGVLQVPRLRLTDYLYQAPPNRRYDLIQDEP